MAVVNLIPIWYRIFTESTADNYRLFCNIMNKLHVNQIKQMEQLTELCERHSWDGKISFASLMTDFPVNWTAGAFVLFIDNNPSFGALNLVEDKAQLSINSSNRPCDTSIICLANYISNHNARAHQAFISEKKISLYLFFKGYNCVKHYNCMTRTINIFIHIIKTRGGGLKSQIFTWVRLESQIWGLETCLIDINKWLD